MGLTSFLIVGSGALMTLGIAIRRYISSKWGSHDTKNEQNVQGKIIIITGANSGLGKETAYELYKRGAVVVMACRNLMSAELSADEIKERAKNERVQGELVPMTLDLESFASVRTFVKNFQTQYDHLDILINNAGVYMPHSHSSSNTTSDGFEIHFQINHLSQFLLTILLIDQLKKGSPSRIITVSSQLYQSSRLDMTDINLRRLEPSEANSGIPYSNSKLANILFSRELASRIKGNGIFTYVLSPGWVKTGLFRYRKLAWHKYIAFLPFALLTMRSSHKGCQTILHCALSIECGNETGKMYRNCDHWIPNAKVTEKLGQELWIFSENAVGATLEL